MKLRMERILWKVVSCQLLIGIFIFYSSLSFAQSSHKLDSVYALLKTAGEDSTRVNALLFLAGHQLDISDYNRADSLANEELALSEKIKYTKGLAYGHTYLGLAYYYEGNYASALQQYFNALKMEEKIADERGKAITLNNIGLSYNMLKDYEHALEYFYKGLQLKQKLNDVRGTATSLNNIGLVYYKEAKYDSALLCFNKSLNIKESFGDRRGMASNYNNIGTIYSAEGNYAYALAFIQKALKIKEEFGDKYGIASSLSAAGDIYFKQAKYKEALDNLLKALAIDKEIGALDQVQNAESTISKIYEKQNNGTEALKHYMAYIKARDSIFSGENTKKSVKAEMNFEFEKKQVAEKARQDKLDAILKEKERKQQVVIYFISGILLLAVGFAVFVYRIYLQKQKANRLLDEKNQKIETAYDVIKVKNLKITDSITYAKRIQRSMLPAKDEIRKVLPESFVLFKPKAIVSGDFYFISTQHGSTFLAAADCTGHGVPGAFMSMIGFEKLQDTVMEHTGTADILKELNNGIKVSLHQTEELESTRDGMDIALVSIDQHPSANSAKIQFSGANRPLWIIRKGKDEMEEIKADKKAIGGFTLNNASFTEHTVTLEQGDSFYLFSDGYADQFGGPKGKKLTTKKFRDLILSLKEKSMAEQKKDLSVFIEKWRGAEDQLDDILVIGVRI